MYSVDSHTQRNKNMKKITNDYRALWTTIVWKHESGDNVPMKWIRVSFTTRKQCWKDVECLHCRVKRTLWRYPRKGEEVNGEGLFASSMEFHLKNNRERYLLSDLMLFSHHCCYRCYPFSCLPLFWKHVNHHLKHFEYISRKFRLFAYRMKYLTLVEHATVTDFRQNGNRRALNMITIIIWSVVIFEQPNDIFVLHLRKYSSVREHQ